jgi:D-amino-acid dehydrogenase
MKVIVLGAGVIGTTSAWYLARAGHEVLVVDRQSQPGLETSFANGGQISVSHSEPWANPTAPLQVLRWLGREDAPLLFRPRLDREQWLWGMRFLLECLPARARRNTAQALALAIYSREQLHELRRETGIAYDAQTRGILHLYEERQEFAHARAQVEFMNSRGLDVSLKTPEECVAIEPALAQSISRFAGAAYARTDESGDASMFTRNLAALCLRHGVAFRFNVSVTRIELEHGTATRVVVDDERGIEESLRADAYVIALGSYSPLLLRPMGLAVPVYPVKGYSITLPLHAGDEAPYTSLTDHSRKLVFSRLGERLRVAGTAELNGYDTEINAARCQALVARCFELFPRAGQPRDAQFWTGLRPATPSNLPIIGVSRIPNVYLNTGHGTLGWTLSCGSGRALADIVSGRRPEPGFPFLGLEPKMKGAAVSAAPRLSA